MSYYWLTNELSFPPVHFADKQGILALGGDLSIERLLIAYSNGIFPWYSDEEPIIWWCPDPRFVLFPTELKVSKSMRKVLRDNVFKITLDKDFRAVISACQTVPRKGQSGTWITDSMLEAFCELHLIGLAHSVEVWQGDTLVGGLYGLALGRCFFGESMFSNVSNASKAGFITLVELLADKGFHLIDCQMPTDHLQTLGADFMPRKDFLKFLDANKKEELEMGSWSKWLDSK